MDDFLKTLKDKEKELQTLLEKNPLFKKLEGIRNTISLFQDENSNVSINTETDNLDIPAKYDDEKFTWAQKVLFVLKQRNYSFVPELVAELKTVGANGDDEFLTKRVSVTLSFLKSKNIIDAEKHGKKSKYFIK